MYIGIDLGTSSVKAVLIDENQTILGSASSPLQVSRPEPGWSEQTAESWIAATTAAMDELAKAYPREMTGVRGIGLSGQMHGATLLDAADRPLRPCILWNDVRSAAEAAEIDAMPMARTITGNITFPGFTAPKVVWVQRHEPEIFAKVGKIVLPKDYLRLWLSGEHGTDMSDAAGTSWLDVGARRWSDEMLEATGLTRDHMPPLYEGTDVTGMLRAELAERWGISGRPVIAGGAGDNAATAAGVGTVAPGSAFISLGTSGVLFAANERFSPNPDSAVHAFCHALPNTWHQMGVILSAAASIEWLAQTFGTTAADLVAPLEGAAGGPGSLLFLPYLSGERTPHNDAHIRGSFIGLSHDSDRTAMARAVLEGVAYAFADSLEALRVAGATVTRATAVGGGSRSQAWLQILADTLGIVIDIPADGDFGAAFGAARLGLIAAEGADPVAICAPPAIRSSIEPDRARSEQYQGAWHRYRALYPAIKEATAL
ncbi:xylulokinase [Faunimonas pinastri]|uniref:Xylulose kinase n=1 Tax=Faunimonas pinastri TaxID=1855383 RepID=A0A1H9KWC4_9HYPH|nr:xylulokinase [Faunimonas pinastri]SER03460.1 xylulokinase [Faunimonas pinastri]